MAFAGALAITGLLFSACKKEDPEPEPEPVGPIYMENATDIDGNVYHTVKIGSQVWMVESLRTTRYRNGDAIPEVSDFTDWGELATGARCSYGNDASNTAAFGYMYNWFTVDDPRGLAPDGWRIPTPADYHILDDYLGGACGGLKATGTAYWLSPNTGASNATGFAGLGGGERANQGAFDYFGKRLALWTSGEVSEFIAERATLYHNNEDMGFYDYNKRSGFSVRCIKN